MLSWLLDSTIVTMILGLELVMEHILMDFKGGPATNISVDSESGKTFNNCASGGTGWTPHNILVRLSYNLSLQRIGDLPLIMKTLL